MKLVVDKAIWKFLEVHSKSHALRSLSELVKKAESEEPIPRTWLKPSGESKSGKIVQPYVDLGLWHAKLDHGGQHHGEPILVFQERKPGVATAFAIARHDTFASADLSPCRKWLWAQRHEIDWHVSAAAEAVLADLEYEFDHGNKSGL